MCLSPDRQGLRAVTLSAQCPTHTRRRRTQVSHTSWGRFGPWHVLNGSFPASRWTGMWLNGHSRKFEIG